MNMSITTTQQASARIAPHHEKYPQETTRCASCHTKCTGATLPPGAVVLTLRGALPVEHLQRGDRVVTRSGATALKRKHVHQCGCCSLAFERQEVVYVLDDQYWPGDGQAIGPQ